MLPFWCQHYPTFVFWPTIPQPPPFHRWPLMIIHDNLGKARTVQCFSLTLPHVPPFYKWLSCRHPLASTMHPLWYAHLCFHGPYLMDHHFIDHLDIYLDHSGIFWICVFCLLFCGWQFIGVHHGPPFCSWLSYLMPLIHVKRISSTWGCFAVARLQQTTRQCDLKTEWSTRCVVLWPWTCWRLWLSWNARGDAFQRDPFLWVQRPAGICSTVP